jgi:adenine-specific DNA-methyltransferase
MEKRLRLAKNLLKDNGLLFVSIDDNEFSQLKVLCDEILLDNFIATLIWKKSAGVGNDTKYFASDHEYILVYSKNKDKLQPFFVNLDKEIKQTYKYKDNNFNKLGPYKRRNLLYKLPEMNAKRPNLRYPIKCPDNEIIMPSTIWKWSEARFLKAKSENRIEFIKNKHGKWQVYFKMYLYENGKERKMKPRTILLNVGMTKDGTNELKEIFGRKVFDYPKPTALIQHLLQIHPNKEAIILDFFAGTGTTAHAVLKINNNDGGNRKFILCTNNENNICTEICYPRLKWVIQKSEKESNSKLIEGKNPGNLKYFKTDFVDAEPTDKNKEKMVNKSTEMLCLKENCFDKIREGDSFKIFTDKKDKLLGIVYEDKGITNIKKEIKRLNRKMIVYVFSLDDSAREEEFEDVKDLVDLKPIPEVILNIYRRIFK